MTKTLKRIAVLMVSALVLAFAVVPAAFAGEDNCSDDNSCKSGGSDTGSASGGAQTGFGGMAATTNDGSTLAIALAGGGVLVLTAAGFASRRRDTVSLEA
jgi:hypothetical protein